MKQGITLLAMIAVVVVAAAAAACSDPPARPPVETDRPVQPIGGGPGGGAGSDGGPQGDGAVVVPADGGADAGACTNLVNSGGVIDQLAVADNFPNGTGGVILDGTYTITDAKVYVGIGGQPGVTNASFQGTITITGGQAYERVLLFKNSGGVSVENRVSGSIIPNSVNATIALTCPNSIQETVTFTVGVNTLTIGNLVTKEVFIFTKKP